jgi:hypothetical protein
MAKTINKTKDHSSRSTSPTISFVTTQSESPIRRTVSDISSSFLSSPEFQQIKQRIEELRNQGETSQGSSDSIDSVIQELGVLTRAQRQRLGIEPIHFQVPVQIRKTIIKIVGNNPPSTPPLHTSPIPSPPPSPPRQPNTMAGVPRTPWRTLGAVNVPGNQHDLPKNPDKWLPKFNPESRETPDDHINKFMLVVNLRSVEHEDVVCRLFPYTFEGEASTWYFSLQANSITNWDTFEDLFIKKFGDDKSSSILLVELSKIRMGPKERIKYFNQRFLKLLNKMPETSKPGLDIQIDFYSSALPVSIAMFVKRESKNTLTEAMQEALDVEKEISSIASKSPSEDSRSSITTKKTIIKDERKDKDVFDMENLQKVMKTLANEIVDVKGKLVEVSNKPFRPFFKRNPQIPPGGQTSEGVNVDEEEGEDNEEVKDTNVFWDINGIFYEDDTKESLAAQTRSKSTSSNSETDTPTNTQPVENKSVSKSLVIPEKLIMIL